MREYLTIVCKNNILSILIFEKEVFMVVVKIGDGMGNSYLTMRAVMQRRAGTTIP